MLKAWVDGASVSLEAAANAAARLLEQSRLPVVAGLGTDVAGVRAAVALAERLRGVYDHIEAPAVFRDLDVMRQAGWMVTTPNEARLHADLLLFVGSGLTTAWPQMLQRLDAGADPRLGDAATGRKMIWIKPDRGEAPKEALSLTSATSLTILMGCLRAVVAGRPSGLSAAEHRKVKAVAELLQNARFGVAIWSAQTLDSPAIEMLCGLVGDLNKTTRFSGLPLAAPTNAAGALQVSGWMTGFPMRTGFGRGYPEHDTWRFDSTRLIDSGEADAALWISALGADKPAWQKSVPLVALTPPQTRLAQAPHVQIEVGAPGLDHSGILHAQDTGTLVAVAAQKPSDAPSVAHVIGLIEGQLQSEAGSC